MHANRRTHNVATEILTSLRPPVHQALSAAWQPDRNSGSECSELPFLNSDPGPDRTSLTASSASLSSAESLNVRSRAADRQQISTGEDIQCLGNCHQVIQGCHLMLSSWSDQEEETSEDMAEEQSTIIYKVLSPLYVGHVGEAHRRGETKGFCPTISSEDDLHLTCDERKILEQRLEQKQEKDAVRLHGLERAWVAWQTYRDLSKVVLAPSMPAVSNSTRSLIPQKGSVAELLASFDRPISSHGIKSNTTGASGIAGRSITSSAGKDEWSWLGGRSREIERLFRFRSCLQVEAAQAKEINQCRRANHGVFNTAIAAATVQPLSSREEEEESEDPRQVSAPFIGIGQTDRKVLRNGHILDSHAHTHDRSQNGCKDAVDGHCGALFSVVKSGLDPKLEPLRGMWTSIDSMSESDSLGHGETINDQLRSFQCYSGGAEVEARIFSKNPGQDSKIFAENKYVGGSFGAFSHEDSMFSMSALADGAEVPVEIWISNASAEMPGNTELINLSQDEFNGNSQAKIYGSKLSWILTTLKTSLIAAVNSAESRHTDLDVQEAVTRGIAGDEQELVPEKQVCLPDTPDCTISGHSEADADIGQIMGSVPTSPHPTSQRSTGSRLQSLAQSHSSHSESEPSSNLVPSHTSTPVVLLGNVTSIPDMQPSRSSLDIQPAAKLGHEGTESSLSSHSSRDSELFQNVPSVAPDFPQAIGINKCSLNRNVTDPHIGTMPIVNPFSQSSPTNISTFLQRPDILQPRVVSRAHSSVQMLPRSVPSTGESESAPGITHVAFASAFISIKLEVDYDLTAGAVGSQLRQAFENDLKHDLAYASGWDRNGHQGIPPKNFGITMIARGSVLVDLEIFGEGSGLNPRSVAERLQSQVSDPHSLLKLGIVTRSTISITLSALDDSPHVPSRRISPKKMSHQHSSQEFETPNILTSSRRASMSTAMRSVQAGMSLAERDLPISPTFSPSISGCVRVSPKIHADVDFHAVISMIEMGQVPHASSRDPAAAFETENVEFSLRSSFFSDVFRDCNGSSATFLNSPRVLHHAEASTSGRSSRVIAKQGDSAIAEASVIAGIVHDDATGLHKSPVLMSEEILHTDPRLNLITSDLRVPSSEHRVISDAEVIHMADWNYLWDEVSSPGDKQEPSPRSIPTRPAHGRDDEIDAQNAAQQSIKMQKAPKLIPCSHDSGVQERTRVNAELERAVRGDPGAVEAPLAKILSVKSGMLADPASGLQNEISAKRALHLVFACFYKSFYRKQLCEAFKSWFFIYSRSFHTAALEARSKLILIRRVLRYLNTHARTQRLLRRQHHISLYPSFTYPLRQALHAWRHFVADQSKTKFK